MPRNIRNIVVNSRMQGQWIAYCLGAYILGSGAMGMAAIFVYSRISTMVSANDSNLHLQITNYILTGGLPTIVGICVAIGILTVVPYGLFLSHRTAGPVVALRRYIRSIRAGDYQAPLHLREADELQDLANELLALTKTLQDQEAMQQGRTTKDDLFRNKSA